MTSSPRRPNERPVLNRPPLVPIKEYELPCRACDPESDEPICTCAGGAGLSGLAPADYGDDQDQPDEVGDLLAALEVEVPEDANVFSLLDRLRPDRDDRPEAA